jgi:hypothetical protein
LLLALAGMVLLVLAEFSEISKRTTTTGPCSDLEDPGLCRTYGHDSHAFALLILTPVALAMAWGAVVGRSRAAAAALAAIGLTVLFIALAIDLPKLDDTRGLEARYAGVTSRTEPAFRLELVGGVLLLLAGGLALLRARGEDSPWEPGARRRRRRASEAAEEGEGDADGVSAAEARARERARRRAARTGRRSGTGTATEPRDGAAAAGAGDTELAAMPPPEPSDPTIATMPPPEPGSAARAPDPDRELNPDAYKRDAGTAEDGRGRYDQGPVSILWSMQGASVQVEVLFDTQPVTANTLSPEDTEWDTGRQESSGGWCEATFELAAGQLNLVRLTWVEGEGGEENTSTGVLLASWPFGS